ncbi:TlpA family protein disulfide reductase [Marinilabilia salmonicolor]|uniref:TlpA family protein disulfide reductase n=1 Tax=Marinilabilia salmonicolor TaxID=989 RepID=UPI00029AD1E6|nr:TlpA disulfide reductase family protein [Marinilabilia salmonicolor]
MLRKFWEKYSRKKRWWTIALDFIFAGLLIAMLFPATRKPLSAFLIRQTLFSPSEQEHVVYLSDKDWSMQLASEGEEGVMSLAQFQGKPVFLNFWATWCPPCIAEMPSIQELYDEYRNEVAFVLVSNESVDVIKSYFEKHGYSFPIYILRSGVPAVFETSTIPSTYLIGSNGRLLISKTGAAKWNSSKMKSLLDDLIN